MVTSGCPPAWVVVDVTLNAVTFTAAIAGAGTASAIRQPKSSPIRARVTPRQCRGRTFTSGEISDGLGHRQDAAAPDGAREAPCAAAHLDLELGARDTGQLEHLAVVPRHDLRGGGHEGAPGQHRCRAGGRRHGGELAAEGRAVERDVAALVAQDAVAGGGEHRVVVGQRQHAVVAQRHHLGGEQHADLAAQAADVAQRDERGVAPVRLELGPAEALAQDPEPAGVLALLVDEQLDRAG